MHFGTRDAPLKRMVPKSGSYKIIWAVDALTNPEGLHTQTAELVGALASQREATVQPVYVLTPSESVDNDLDQDPMFVRYEQNAHEALEKALESALNQRQGMPILAKRLPARVLVQATSSIHATVATLSNFAVSEGADLIVVSTHAREGLSRLFLGSFTETLLLSSRIPVWVVNPSTRKIERFTEIIYPTDFSFYSRGVFRRVVQMARELGAKMTLFHAVPHPIEPVFQSGVYMLGGGALPLLPYHNDAVHYQMKHAERWARWAEARGVQVKTNVQDEPENIATTIAKLAQDHQASMIAMETHSGPVVSALVGSITRQVVRHADCPVWVLNTRVEASHSGLTEPGKAA